MMVILTNVRWYFIVALDIKQLICSKFGQEYDKAVYCHHACLTYMQKSLQFSHPVVSISLGPYGLQHARTPRPLSTQEFMRTHVHWVGDAIQPAHPLSSPSPPALIFPSIRVLSNESALHIRWPKHWSFSFNISPTNKHPGLISFRMDWLDRLAVQGTLKSLLHHHSSKA